ncbi:PfkB family carbohydrate kinase [bacterium]|nr:PfkB family carbohydrate kinase [bacterium]
MIRRKRVAEIIENFKQQRVVVVGDIMLDRDWRGVVERISPEAPVPVLRVTEVENFLGGAGNVANNLRELGASVELAGIVGEDDAGGWIFRELANCDVEMAFYMMRDKGAFERVVILSGDGDFLPVLKHLREVAKKEVLVLARGPRTAREIKQFAGDKFINLISVNMREKLARVDL